jgi:hypothetical protein
MVPFEPFWTSASGLVRQKIADTFGPVGPKYSAGHYSASADRIVGSPVTNPHHVVFN